MVSFCASSKHNQFLKLKSLFVDNHHTPLFTYHELRFHSRSPLLSVLVYYKTSQTLKQGLFIFQFPLETFHLNHQINNQLHHFVPADQVAVIIYHLGLGLVHLIHLIILVK